jgi:acyl-CoA reductase-like NAD-dependent aldehyde dehydrogenase
MPTTISHWMNNTVFPGTGAATAPVTNPATGAVTGEVVLGSVEDGRAVIDAAAAAFPAWRDTSLAKRSAMLFAFRERLNARKGELARIMTASTARWFPTHSARSAAARRSSNSPVASRICSKAGSPRTPQPRSTSTRSANLSGRSASSARSTSPPGAGDHRRHLCEFVGAD